MSLRRILAKGSFSIAATLRAPPCQIKIIVLSAGGKRRRPKGRRGSRMGCMGTVPAVTMQSGSQEGQRTSICQGPEVQREWCWRRRKLWGDCCAAHNIRYDGEIATEKPCNAHMKRAQQYPTVLLLCCLRHRPLSGRVSLNSEVVKGRTAPLE